MSTLVTTYESNAKALNVDDVIVVISIFLIYALYYLLLKIKKPEVLNFGLTLLSYYQFKSLINQLNS